MNNLLCLFFLVIGLASCNQDMVVPTEDRVLTNNVGLTSIHSSQYYTSTVQCTVRLSQGVKITTETLKFNIVNYQSGSLEFSFTDLCTLNNPNLNTNKTILCDSYTFSNVVIKSCQ